MTETGQPRQRLAELLVDPSTAQAARLVGKRWAIHDDDERLGHELDVLEAEIPTEAGPVTVDLERLDAINARLKTLRAMGPVLEVAIRARDRLDLGVAEIELDRIEAGIKSVQEGSDEPLGVRWRGEFERGTIYYPGDLVTNSVATYVCAIQTSDAPFVGSRLWDLIADSKVGPAGPSGGGGVGPQGPKGDPGPQNLFIQESDPHMSSPGVWFELRSDGSVKSLWVENGLSSFGGGGFGGSGFGGP